MVLNLWRIRFVYQTLTRFGQSTMVIRSGYWCFEAFWTFNRKMRLHLDESEAPTDRHFRLVIGIQSTLSSKCRSPVEIGCLCRNGWSSFSMSFSLVVLTRSEQHKNVKWFLPGLIDVKYFVVPVVLRAFSTWRNRRNSIPLSNVLPRIHWWSASIEPRRCKSNSVVSNTFKIWKKKKKSKFDLDYGSGA